MEKSVLRKRLATLRDDESDREQKSQRISDGALALPELCKAVCVGCYASVGSEVDTWELLKKLLLLRKRLFLPYCDSNQMALCEICSLDELEVGSFGILEPKNELRTLSERRLPDDELDVLIIPGVGFDRSGMRLGRGKGFYDRFLSALPASVLRVGLAFECQVIDKLPAEAHDAKMDVVITERHVYACFE